MGIPLSRRKWSVSFHVGCGDQSRLDVIGVGKSERVELVAVCLRRNFVFLPSWPSLVVWVVRVVCVSSHLSLWKPLSLRFFGSGSNWSASVFRLVLFFGIGVKSVFPSDVLYFPARISL